MPSRPNLNEMRHATRENKKTERDKHPAIGQVTSVADEVDQCNQDGKIRESDQRVRDNLEPGHIRPHQGGRPLRHELGIENLSEKLNHRDTIPASIAADGKPTNDLGPLHILTHFPRIRGVSFVANRRLSVEIPMTML
jgi:hypothetical protein